MKSLRIHCVGLLAGLLATASVQAQVSAYSFTSEVGSWMPLSGAGTLLGMPGMPPAFNYYDDNSFVSQGTNILIGYSSTGSGWPIGFTFNFNGHAYDRVGLSTEGWLAFGQSTDGNSAVNVPIGNAAYTPLSSAEPMGAPLKRNRIAGFAMDLAAQGSGGLWPIQLMTAGFAPNRIFVAEWNMVRSGGSNPVSFQIQLYEGGGVPAQQVVKVVYGTMAQSIAMAGQVGLGGDDPSDFNNRSVAVSPYDWQLNQPGATNTATCRLPSASTNLPQGLTFTWSPPGCVVTGISLANLARTAGSISGTLSWDVLAGASGYDYVITAGGPNDPPILSGTGITDTTVTLSGLPPDSSLFVYVRADCGQGMGEWGAGLPFNTDGIVEVVCGDPPVAATYCYDNLEDRTWHYNSSSGATLRMIINAGDVYNGDVLAVYDGNSIQSSLLFSSANGTIAGQVINSSGPNLTMRLISDDIGSCATQSFILPMEWEVGCLDCTPVLANFSVVNDCANQQFSVQVDLFSMGSAPTVIIGSNAGSTTVTASTTGTYSIGPFPVDTPVVVTAANPDNAYCSAVSQSLLNNPCPTVSCGPDEYTQCYTNNDHSLRAFQSDNNGRIGIRFMAGTLASGDAVNIYDGLDPAMSAPLFTGNNGGNLNGLMRVTSAGNPDHAILLETDADNYNSCSTGQAFPWRYVVACYDGCTPPAASFTTVPDCDHGTFSIAVNVASLGSAPSLEVVNDGNAPSITANAPGTYLTGPFPVGQHVVVEVQGSSVLCTVNSDTLTENCTIGITENYVDQMHIFPNPSDGTFRLVIPKGFGGHCQLEVLDVTGSSVARRILRGYSGLGVDCDLGYLPAGRYVLVMDDGKSRLHAPITLVH
jgi:hypothetical protein